MTLAAECIAFTRSALRASTINALDAALKRATRRLGFDHFAVIDHQNILKAGSDAVFLHNYPPAWAATLYVRGYMADDPIAEVCRRQSAPFLWSDISSLIAMSSRQREIMREARHAGLAQGCTAPIHVEGEPVGSCSFVTAGALPAQALDAVTSIGRCAFDEARRIVRRGLPAKKRQRLTPREHECLALIGRGASDLEVSQALAIPEAAVAGHIEEARRKYGVANRMELVVRALYRGELKFDELVAVEEEPAGLSLVRQVRSAAEEPVPMARLAALFFGTTSSELN